MIEQTSGKKRKHGEQFNYDKDENLESKVHLIL